MEQAKVYVASSVYIDPLDCDSTISFKIIRRRKGDTWGTVQLSDCNRKIDWYFADSTSSVKKIDNAIEALQAFRTEFIKARASKLKPSAKKKKKA